MLESALDRLTRWLIKKRWLVVLFWGLLLPVFVYGFLNVSNRLLTIVKTYEEADTTFVFRAKAKRFAKQSQFLALMTLHHDGKKYDDDAFDNDLGWDAALDLIAELRTTAARVGLTLGVKLTNTLASGRVWRASNFSSSAAGSLPRPMASTDNAQLHWSNRLG